MRQFLELDLVANRSFDIQPDFVLIVEEFTTPPEDVPDAKTFVLVMDGPQIGRLHATTTYDEMRDVILASNPSDWFEVNTKGGNRCLFRRSQVMSRQSLPEGEEGSVITFTLMGQPQGFQVKETVEELRQLMKGPEPVTGNVVPLIPEGS